MNKVQLGQDNFYPRPPRGGRPISSFPLSFLRYFYPRPPRGGRRRQLPPQIPAKKFLSTPSARRATGGNFPRKSPQKNFYPRPPRGGRPTSAKGKSQPCFDFYPRPPRGGRRNGAPPRWEPLLFLSTPSARRATGTPAATARRRDNFYPRPPRGGRRCGAALRHAARVISIHALREEGDLGLRYEGDKAKVFLSTPSARRATHQTGRPATRPGQFLSTPSARRATPSGRPVVYSLCNFYPRPPRGGRPTRLM